MRTVVLGFLGLSLLGCLGLGGKGKDKDGDGFSEDQGDCNDGFVLIFPGAPEVCDGVDQDCDGQVDDDPTDGQRFYEDADGDGSGNADERVDACDAPDGYVDDADDCDDDDPDVQSCDTGPDPGDVDITAADLAITWTTFGLDLQIAGTTADEVYLGMAETANPTTGWFGEDCIDDDGLQDANLCHDSAEPHFSLDRVTSLDLLVPGETTMFDVSTARQGSADRLTYMLDLSDTAAGTHACYVWGHDPAWYTIDHVGTFGDCAAL